MLQLLVLSLPFLFAFFVLKWLATPTAKRKNLPPSVPKLPIIGNMHQLGGYPHQSLRALARRYGPLMTLRFGSKNVVIASSADFAREIMKTHDITFANRPKYGVFDKLLYNCKDVSSAPYSEYWRQLRSICVLQLLSNKRVQSFKSIREEETTVFMNKIRESSSKSLPVNMSDSFASFNNDIICRVALGKKYDGISEATGRKFKDLIGEFMVVLGAFNVGDFIPWLRWVNHVNGFEAQVDRVSQEFDAFLEGVVQEHTAASKRGDSKVEEKKDFVDVLLELQNDTALGFSLERDSIKALILDMFSAGTETSYAVLEWCFSELMRNPRIMRELQKEVRGIVGGKQEITESDLEKMVYLKAVIKETLRLYPPVPLLVPREASQDVKLKGYDIEAGTTVFINAWAIGRDPETWKDAEEFKPERFFETSIDFRGHDFEFIPFGAGRRGCPGIAFAMATEEVVLANLMNNFDWSLPDGASAEDLDMTAQCQGLTLHRKVPLQVAAIPVSR